MFLFAAPSPAPPPTTTSFMIPSGFAILIGIGWFIVHVAFALGVYTDANEQEERQARVWFGGAILWGFATLMGGVFVAVAYWLLHHSSLSVGAAGKKGKKEKGEAAVVYTAPVATPAPPPEDDAPVVSPYALAAPPAPPPEPTPPGGSRPDIDEFKIERTPLDS